MDARDRLLAVARRLTIEHGAVPSLNAVAAAAGVSKGGLVHHFPSRMALVDGLAREAIDRIERAMAAAAQAGAAALTWLRLATPDAGEMQLFHALAVAWRSTQDDPAGTLTAASDATDRWEALIAAEVGDELTARVIRLVGDGITFNAMAGLALDENATTRLLDRIRQLFPAEG